MLQLGAELVEKRALGPAQACRLRAPALAAQLGAGQAVLVRATSGAFPALRRPFYPISVDAETWTLRLPADGDRGHAWLRAAPVGTQIDCLGPVGLGYRCRPGTRHLLCLGEGDAAWYLLPAVHAATEQGLSVTLAAESLTLRQAVPAALLPLSAEYRLITGNSGRPGEHLRRDGRELLAWADVVFAAGSPGFYAGLTEAIMASRFSLKRGFAQVLYQGPLLCGTGACGACTTEIAGRRHRVCLRGPVFDLVDVQP